jgi:glycine betaine/proline transport system permease protein
LGATVTLGLLWPAIETYPPEWRLSTGDFWSRVMEHINVTYFDTLEAIKTAVLVHLLVPIKRLLLGLPWLGLVVFLAFAGWRLGGWRLALQAGGLTTVIAFTGLWEEAMTTLYLCGVSVVIAMAIGLPIGILTAERAGLWRPVRVIIDTLQTLPSFVYLMPAVMLFRVGDFTAMLAVVAFAVVPAIRFTVLGLNGIDPRLIEAGRAMGCTRWQILTRIKLRLALPEILLGLNQTIMFALSMLVITALVGTRDLGQEVYVALTRANAGQGLVAGLAIAFMAIIADRLIAAAALRARQRLGLTGGAHGA